MKYRRRRFFTDKQKSEIWDRWQLGESMSSIGRGFDRASSSIYPLLARTGGIRPPDRSRSQLALTLAEREEISRGLIAQHSLRSIALALNRSASTVSRAVSAKLQRKWSPEQIAGWLKRAFPGESQKQVSHETIYRSLYIQARGVLKKELLEHLRAKRTVRRSRHASLKRNGLGQIKDAISISQRPASVEDRAVPGHWEGDLIGGSGNSYIATLVERHSRYVMLVKVANKDTESVVSALIKQSQRLPRELYKTLTWDRGKELADHPRLAMAADVDVYFCDPQSA